MTDLPTVWRMTRSELAHLGQSAHPVDVELLAGHAYRGVSLGLPAWVDRLLWKVFRKVFDRDPQTGTVTGHNVRALQSDAVVPLARGGASPGAMLRRGAPVTFGPFRVAAQDGPNPFATRGGAVLDYGACHPMWHPMAYLKDVLVALEPGDPRVLLGAMWIEVGGRQVATPSWFTLEREEAPTPGPQPSR